MRRYAVLLALAVSGCGFFKTEQSVEVVPEDTETRLPDNVGFSLSEWLILPRAELAKMADDKAEALQKQQDFTRHNPEALDLLPKLHPAIRVPGFAKAKFDETAGFSLPPYLKPGAKDAAVALHLARLGDLEAAKKIAPAAIAPHIDSFATEKNYPVEWTRLVGLQVCAAELQLVGGDIHAAGELVQLHKQLLGVLDSKAAAGPLGAALLPLGRRALGQAADQLRNGKTKRTVIADDITAALAEWGDTPKPAPVLTPGTAKELVASVLGATANGHVVAVDGPAVLRGLDLFGLPFVDEGVEAVVAFLNDKGQFARLSLFYKPRIIQVLPDTAALAQGLVDDGLSADEPVTSEGQIKQTYKLNDLTIDVSLFTRTTRLGGVVHVHAVKGSQPVTHLPATARDLGAVNLDFSFEQNRLAIRPDSQGDTLTIEKPELLAKLASPIKKPAPVSAVLKREGEHNLVRSLALHWPAESNHQVFTHFLVPLWAAFGASRVEPVADDHGGHFNLIWQDGNTRLTLQLPNEDERGTDLVFSDTRTGDQLKSRTDIAIANDQAQRKARLAAGKARQRLPRSLHLDGVKLGMPKAQVLTALPRGRLVRQTPMADGVSMLFLTQPEPNATHSARQMFVRFGPDDKLAEIRVRYNAGPQKPDKEHPSLFDILKRGGGSPEPIAAPWAKLWTDLPVQKPVAEMFRWIDDLTVMTYERDAGGIEVALTNTDTDHPLGIELPPLRFCGRGIEACNLGDRRFDVLKRWRIDKPTVTPDGALFFGQPENSPYDLVLVWFEDDRAVRIVAQHKLKDGKPLKVEDVPNLLQAAWAQDIDRLGTLRRQYGTWGQVYGTYGWNDDKTRVLIHVQDTEQHGPRMFTEWREWPIPVKEVAAKP